MFRYKLRDESGANLHLAVRSCIVRAKQSVWENESLVNDSLLIDFIQKSFKLFGFHLGNGRRSTKTWWCDGGGKFACEPCSRSYLESFFFIFHVSFGDNTRGIVGGARWKTSRTKYFAKCACYPLQLFGNLALHLCSWFLSNGFVRTFICDFMHISRSVASRVFRHLTSPNLKKSHTSCVFRYVTWHPRIWRSHTRALYVHHKLGQCGELLILVLFDKLRRFWTW